jgi:hypothetical protein
VTGRRHEGRSFKADDGELVSRRHVVGGAGSLALLLGAPALARPSRDARLTFGGDGGDGATMPADFAGLSYEAAQLANPAFFSPANRAQIALFRELSPSGNLRIGGGTSAFVRYSPMAPAGPPPFEVFGPDTSATTKHETVISDAALQNLRGFLDATGWTCLYGLDLARDSKANTVAEAVAAHRFLGPKLLAIQIGNEPDSYRGRYRPRTWGPADYVREWNEVHDAIAAAAPGIRFAGPDISNKLDFLTAFATGARRHRDIVMLTMHYYALGPAGSPDATLPQLMSDAPREATLKPSGLPTVAAACETARLPLRISEGNSCWNGGQPGVSDTYAAALWCADTMLRFAQRGWIGFNLHGGGDGIYSPIIGGPTRFSRRPIYSGIRFAQALSGGRFAPVDAAGLTADVSIYALEQQGRRQLVVINKGLSPVTLALPVPTRGAAMALTGPSLTSKVGARIVTIERPSARRITVPPITGMIQPLGR